MLSDNLALQPPPGSCSHERVLGGSFQRSRMVRHPAVNRTHRRFDSFRWSSRFSARVPAFARRHAPALRVRSCPCFSKVEHPLRTRSVPVRFRTWALVSSSRKDPTRHFVGSIPTAYSARKRFLLWASRWFGTRFSQMRPHTAVSSLGRYESARALDGRGPALYAVTHPVRFRTRAPVPPNRTDPTRTSSWFESSRSPRRSGADSRIMVNDAQWPGNRLRNDQINRFAHSGGTKSSLRKVAASDLRPCRLMVKISGFQSEYAGSIPARGTTHRL